MRLFFHLIFDSVFLDFGLHFRGFLAPKIQNFDGFFLSFFESFFGFIFFGFFVDFLSLESLKIVLPPRRELNFYKIGVFVLSSKIDQKTMDLGVQKSSQNHEKSLKSMSESMMLFNIDFY